MLKQKTLTGLASHLVFNGLLSQPAALDALQHAKAVNMRFISYLVHYKIIASDNIFDSCKKSFDFPWFDLSNYESQWINNLALSPEHIRQYHAIPLYIDQHILHIGISDPTDRTALDAISFHLGSRVQGVLVDEELLTNTLSKYFYRSTMELNLLDNISITHELGSIQENIVHYDEPLVRFVDNIIQDAIHQSASDIHIEPFEAKCRIRFRRDGILSEAAEVPIELAGRLATRLKVMAKLDIAERRLPQDGHIQLFNRDIRISTCPTLFGEKIVLRILNTSNTLNDLSTLGLLEPQLALLSSTLAQPQGMILVTGPTGSGKTVTLYSALQHLNATEKNISTVEDPIEIQLSGINQINIHPKIGLTFSYIVRTLLRQDPDVIMIGEIRDLETAEIAIQAAQTGHLVLSTLHTNSAIDTITRLQALGIPSHSLVNTISLIIAQRLVRKLCEHCKVFEATTGSGHYTACGCQYCLNGYIGRTGIYEILPISPRIADLIVSSNPSSSLLQQQLSDDGFISLKSAAQQKVNLGITSLAEIERVLI